MTEKTTAEARLQEVLAEEPYGERALRTILRREGYADEDVEAAVAGVNWGDQAARAAEEIASLSAVPDLHEAVLRAQGFTEEEASDAVSTLTAGRQDDPTERLWKALSELDADTAISAQLRQLFEKPESKPDQELIAAAQAGDMRARALILARSGLAAGVSRSQLQDTLETVGLPRPVVRETIRDLNPNWKQQAVLFAENLAVQGDNRTEIQQTMREAGFTPVQVAYALSVGHIHDAEAAVAMAREFVLVDGRSIDALQDMLEERGFGVEEVNQAADALLEEKIDWTAAGSAALRRMLDDPEMLVGGEENFREFAVEQGYTEAQIDGAVADVDWVKRAQQDHRKMIDEGAIESGFGGLKAWSRQIEMIGYDAETAKKAAEAYLGDLTERQALLLSARGIAEFAHSPKHLRELMENDGLDEETVQWIMDRVFIDPVRGAGMVWSEASAKMLVEGEVASPLDLRRMLEEEGFDEETIAAVPDWTEAPWTDIAGMYAVSLWAQDLNESDIRDEMLEEQFDPADVENALQQVRKLSTDEAWRTMRVTMLMMERELLVNKIDLLEESDGDTWDDEELDEAWEQLEALEEELIGLGAELPTF